MKTSDTVVLFDTNILIHAQNTDSPHHKKAIELHKEVFEGKIKAVLSAQNLLEFYSEVTNPKRLVKPLTSSFAISEIKKYLKKANFRIIKTKGNELELLLNLVKDQNVRGVGVFDVYLMEKML